MAIRVMGGVGLADGSDPHDDDDDADDAVDDDGDDDDGDDDGDVLLPASCHSHPSWHHDDD